MRGSTMMRFRDLRFFTKLCLLAVVCVLGLGAFAALSFNTLATVKVNGPLYKSIVQGKDIIADVLPPPEYIIESYLVVLEMTHEQDPAALQKLAERGVQLRKDYDVRHEFWIADLAEGEMKQTLLVASYEPAVRFYQLRDEQFVPAMLKGDREAALTLATGSMREAYLEH